MVAMRITRIITEEMGTIEDITIITGITRGITTIAHTRITAMETMGIILTTIMTTMTGIFSLGYYFLGMIINLGFNP